MPDNTDYPKRYRLTRNGQNLIVSPPCEELVESFYTVSHRVLKDADAVRVVRRPAPLVRLAREVVEEEFVEGSEELVHLHR